MKTTNTTTSSFIKQSTFEAVRDFIFEDPEWLYSLVEDDMEYLVKGLEEDEEPDRADVDYIIYNELTDKLVSEIAWEWDWEEDEGLTKEDKAHLRNVIKKIFKTGYGVEFETKEIVYSPMREGLYRFRLDPSDEYRYFYLKRESPGAIRRWWDLPLKPCGCILRFIRENHSMYVDINEEDEFLGRDLEETRSTFYKAWTHSELVEIPKMDIGNFIAWLDEGKPVCMDCGKPVISWYRDGDADRYRCEECQWKAYSEEEWDKLCEEYEDECYYTDLY